MTRYTLRQLEKKRKEERRDQIMSMVGVVFFALVIGLCMIFAR